MPPIRNIKLNRPNLFSVAYPDSVVLNRRRVIQRVDSSILNDPIIVAQEEEVKPNIDEMVQKVQAPPWKSLPPLHAKPEPGFITQLQEQYPPIATTIPTVEPETSTTCTFYLYDAYIILEFMKLLHHELLLDTNQWIEKQMITTFPQFFHIHGFEKDMRTLFMNTTIAHRITNQEFMQYVIRHMYVCSFTLIRALTELVYYIRNANYPWMDMLSNTHTSILLIRYILNIRRDVRANLDMNYQSGIVMKACTQTNRQLNEQMRNMIPAVLISDRTMFTGTSYTIQDIPKLEHTHFQQYSLYHFLYADSLLKPVTEQGTTYDAKTMFLSLVAQSTIIPLGVNQIELEKRIYHEPRNYYLLIMFIQLIAHLHCQRVMLKRVHIKKMYDRLRKLIDTTTQRIKYLLTILN